jgi:type IV pilus assembly protein PilV
MRSYSAMERHSSGFTLIEVLITFVIVAIGLLGLAGVQMISMNNQLEASQRAQAILLVEDMANRIRANAVAAKTGAYPIRNTYGAAVEDCTGLTATADLDMCQWNNSLVGTGTTAGGQNLGSIDGAVGCVQNIVGSTDGETIIQVSIAWQGMRETVVPSTLCGQGQFGNDDFRRTTQMIVVLANMA